MSRIFDSDYLKENREIVEKLRTMPALSYFEEKDLEGILGLSKMLKYDPGELIIQEGQYDNWIFFIVSGKVSIQMKGETIAILKSRGDLFGEMGVIDGSPRSATIRAIDETFCLAIDVSYWDRLKGESKLALTCTLYRVFAEILASRLRLRDEEWVRLKDENAALRAELEKMKACV